MKQLKKDYIESLQVKRSKISDLYQQQKLVELETEFHKMKGSGKTYGLAEVSIFGEILEAICIACPEQLPKAMPVAIVLIDETYRLQNLEQSFDIEKSNEYLFLKSILDQTPKSPTK